jgi:dihydrofolate reductase
MNKLKYSTSMSLDGFVAGVNQSVENPLGVNGLLLHKWMRELAIWRINAGVGTDGEVNASTAVLQEDSGDTGAIVMGRNMFGGGPGPWGDDPWNGWWGEDPPFHVPVFVLTHYPREPLVMKGGTTFTFVTQGPAVALELARKAADGKDISIGGGATVAKQFLAANLIDDLQISLVPLLLYQGIRLFDMQPIPLEQVRVIEAPDVTHIKYRVVK